MPPVVTVPPHEISYHCIYEQSPKAKREVPTDTARILNDMNRFNVRNSFIHEVNKGVAFLLY